MKTDYCAVLLVVQFIKMYKVILAFESVDETRPFQMKAVELAYVASVSEWFGCFSLLERAEISTRTKKTLSSHYSRDQTAKKAQNSNIEQYCDIVNMFKVVITFGSVL